jgi:hypothetical protein
MSAPLGGHERIYRSLLRLYPADYRATYTEPMVQLFADQVRDEGAGRSWFRAMGDVPRSAVSEHLRRNRTVAHSMSVAPSPTSRLLGTLGVVGGAVLLLGFVNLEQWTPDLFNLRLILFNLGAIAIAIGVHFRQASAGRLLSLSAAIAVIAANAAYLVLILRAINAPGEIGPGDYQPAWLWPYVGGAMWLSDAWFGLVTFRLRVLNRWSALALLIGSLAAFAGMGIFGLAPTGSVMEAIILTGMALHGLAWVLLGLEVALRRRMIDPATPA